MTILGLYALATVQADDILQREHKWLLDHEDLIRALVDREYREPDRTKQAQRVYNRLMAWGSEFAWFTQPDAGVIHFPEICDRIGADVEVAREKRQRYFKLPIPPLLIYGMMRNHGARTVRRGRPKKRVA